jgi:hypothetical protein
MEPLGLLGGPEGQLQSICHGPSPPPPTTTFYVSSSFKTTNKKVQNVHLQIPSTLFAKAAALLLYTVPFNMSALSSGSISLPKCYFSIPEQITSTMRCWCPPKPPFTEYPRGNIISGKCHWEANEAQTCEMRPVVTSTVYTALEAIASVYLTSSSGQAAPLLCLLTLRT